MLTDFDKDLAGIDLTAENAVQLILDAANTRSDGLSNKNTELLGKLSNNENLSAAEKAKLIELEKFKSDAGIKTAKDAEDWQTASDLQQTAHNTAMDELKNTNSANAELITKLLIDDGLNKALDGVRINPALKEGAEAMLRSTATITDGKAMIGDKSLSDAVTEWASTDAGKAFCLAENNSGGNGLGGGGSPSGKKLTLTEQAILANKAG